MGTLILFILILGIIILIHELGHFLFAKLFGVYVYEYSIGMGKKIFSKKPKDSETEYNLRLIPIGGFVRLAGEEGEDGDTTVPVERKLYKKKFYQRFLIFFMGPGFNFILAFVTLFVGALIYGSINTSPIVGLVQETAPAYAAGVEAGDKILSIDGEIVKSWDDILWIVQTSNGKSLTFEIEDKNGNEKNITVTPEEITNEDGTTGFVYGIGKNTKKEKGLVTSFKYACNKTISLFKIMIETVKSLFTGGVSVDDLSGPVGIYSIVGEQAEGGLEDLLYLLAYLSINVGVINLIPFPAFDGGHILFLLIEKIMRKPVPEKVESTITGIGFILLILLMIYVTGHDIINLFN